MVLKDPREQARYKTRSKSDSLSSMTILAGNRTSTASKQSIAQANPKGVILSRISHLKSFVVKVSRRCGMLRLMIANASFECSNTTRMYQ